MKTLVFGSANIDRTYTLPHFVEAGETVAATKLEVFCGGKGFNQAIAFARAGSQVWFAGAIGEDGLTLKEHLIENNINVDYLQVSSEPSGQAIIQVNSSGQNSIIILAGANGTITGTYADHVLNSFEEGDLIVLQNEITNVDYIIKQAHSRGLTVAFNPSPFNEQVLKCDLSDVDYLIVNEIEGSLLSGEEDYAKILHVLHSKYPDTNILLTLGHLGSVFCDRAGNCTKSGIYATKAVDTTAAGDTFLGYFLSTVCAGHSIETALKQAAIASGISVSRKGASPSIPQLEEVQKADKSFLKAFCVEGGQYEH